MALQFQSINFRTAHIQDLPGPRLAKSCCGINGVINGGLNCRHMNMMKNGFKHSQARGFYEGFFSCRPGSVSLDHQRLSEADPLLELQAIQTTWDCKTIWNLCRFSKKPSAASGWPILNTLADPSLPEVWRRRRALHLKPRRPRPEALRKNLGQSHSQTWSATLRNFVSTNMATENGHSNMTLLCQIFTAMNSHIWRQ